jgi:drug/metabolite transporter (DMT)-like permease
MNPLRMQLLLIATMAAWGMNISIVKLLTRHYDTLLISCLRMGLAALVINATLVWSRQPFPKSSLSWPTLWRLLACGLCMVYLNQLFFVGGMKLASATNASLIMALSPLAATLMAAVVFREALSRRRIAGVVLGFGGVFAVVVSSPGATFSSAGLGDLMLLMAVLSFVTGGLIIQSLARQFSALFISSAIYTIGSLALLIHVLASPAVSLTWRTVLPGIVPVSLLIVSGVVGTAMGNMFWSRAISELGASRSSVYQYWIPVFGVGSAMLILGEAFTIWHVVGLAGIILGTWLGTQRHQAPSR